MKGYEVGASDERPPWFAHTGGADYGLHGEFDEDFDQNRFREKIRHCLPKFFEILASKSKKVKVTI